MDSHEPNTGPRGPNQHLDEGRPATEGRVPPGTLDGEDRSQTRLFPSGAVRNEDEGKHDFDGYLSPLVLNRFAEYMTKHRFAGKQRRASDNWKRGIPKASYVKSCWRHFMDWWRGTSEGRDDEEAACAIMFNVMGWLHETLRTRSEVSRLNRIQDVALYKDEFGEHTAYSYYPKDPP